MSPSNNSAAGVCGHGGGLNYIEHQVSRMDTLAGIAIKYGVEVADIRRLNGLAADLQMFALKKLKIPLPGRHPPSPNLSDASALTGGGSVVEEPLHLGRPNMLNSLQLIRLKAPNQNVSPAMSTLQKFYGLKSQPLQRASQDIEMAVYRTGNVDHGLFLNTSVLSTPPSNVLKSWNFASGFFPENDSTAEHVLHAEPGDGESEKYDEKLVRRRQKAEVDNGVGTPERFLKDENSGGSSFFSASNGKGLAMRPKSTSRSMLLSDLESGWINSISLGMGDAIITESISDVHKSSSTSNLRDQDGYNSASAWPTVKWSLKPDLQGLSSAAISKPLFDGLSNPITGRRNKAALD